jgi:hypothetical protein
MTRVDAAKDSIDVLAEAEKEENEVCASSLILREDGKT